jgi:hypothetical protein
MRNLIEEMENKGLGDKTIKGYIQRLYFINGKKKFQSLTFLRKTEEVIKYLKDNLSVSTQKSYAGTILSVLELKPSKLNDKAKKVYSSFISDEDIEKLNSGEKSEKQKDNWISQSEIQDIKKELEKKAIEYSKKPQVSITEYNAIMKNMLLSLYVNLPPRRASDYALMKFQNDTGDKKFNYFTDKDKMVFHNYKTSKTYGTQTIDVAKNKALLKDMKMYLKHRKGDNNNMLLVKANGVAFNAINDITRTLNSIFGKKISTNMLRSIYVTDKYGEMKSGMIEDAEAMSHSVKTQQTQYNKGK